MKTLKNRKWYASHGMRRAVKVARIFRGDVSAVAIGADGLWNPVVSGKGVAISVHGNGFTKEFARATAAIHPTDLYVLIHCNAQSAQFWCDQRNELGD